MYWKINQKPLPEAAQRFLLQAKICIASHHGLLLRTAALLHASEFITIAPFPDRPEEGLSVHRIGNNLLEGSHVHVLWWGRVKRKAGMRHCQ